MHLTQISFFKLTFIIRCKIFYSVYGVKKLEIYLLLQFDVSYVVRKLEIQTNFTYLKSRRSNLMQHSDKLN